MIRRARTGFRRRPRRPSVGTVEEIRDPAALRAVVGEVTERARTKVRPALDDLHRAWIARSPFHLVATSGAPACSPTTRPPSRCR